VAHVVALLKSHTPDLDTKKLQRDFPFDNDEEQDALVDSVYDTAQYFVSQYDFSVFNESDDNVVLARKPSNISLCKPLQSFVNL
jgi:hypothetical protein